jgi:hypothetical protein
MIDLARIVQHLQAQYKSSTTLKPMHATMALVQPLLIITGSGGHFCSGADIR